MGRQGRMFINDMLVAVTEDGKDPGSDLEFAGDFMIDVDQMPDKEKFRLRIEIEKAEVKKNSVFKFWKRPL